MTSATTCLKKQNEPIKKKKKVKMVYAKPETWSKSFIALTTIGIGHLINAIIEAFADSYYTHGGEWSAFMGLVQFVIFFTLLLIFDRKTVRRDRREMERRGRTMSIRLLFGLSCIIVGSGLVVLSLLGVEFAR